jgi:hypothetical protein
MIRRVVRLQAPIPGPANTYNSPIIKPTPKRRIITDNIFNDELYKPSSEIKTSATPGTLEPTARVSHQNHLLSELERERHFRGR